MTEQTQMMGFGFQSDTDKKLQTKAGGNFGLNSGFITKFEHNPNGGSDGAASDVFDITIKVGDKEFQSRFFPITKVFDKDNNEIQDQNTDEWIKGFNTQMMQMKATLTHYLKVWRKQEEIEQAFNAAPPQNFVEYFQLLGSLKPDNFTDMQVDLFLEFQWNIKKDNKMTFLTLPTNMKGGYFVMAHASTIDGEYEAVVTPKKGLTYVNSTGTVHTFDRSENFIKSNKGIQQFEDGTKKEGVTGEKIEANGGNITAAVPNALGTPGAAKKVGWGKA